MKKIFLALLLLPLSLLAQQGFVIAGKLEGFKDSAQAFIVTTTDNTVVTSAPIKKGIFTLTGKVAEPGLYWMVLGDAQAQHIFLENSKIIVTGSRANIQDLKIVGSRSHDDFTVFRSVFTPLMKGLSTTVNQLNELQEGPKRSALIQRYDSLRNQVDSEVGKFVTARRTSFVSPFLLEVTAQVTDDPVLLEERFLLLDSSIRSSQIGTRLNSYIADSKVGSIGSLAIDFTQNDTLGNPVSLSSFRGKYVLLDFWASWCRPCRIENPNVVKAFTRFSPKNFTVLGVSLDRDKEPWIKAIHADQLKWTHVSDLKYWNNEVAQMYKVQGIPQNFLIDPNGKIVGKNLRGEELEARLCELLGCD